MHPYLERLEREAANAEGVTVAPLTVADVLKRSTMTCLVDNNSAFQIVWHYNEWRIYRGGGLYFQSPDESAACAEFLRLTGGGE